MLGFIAFRADPDTAPLLAQLGMAAVQAAPVANCQSERAAPGHYGPRSGTTISETRSRSSIKARSSSVSQRVSRAARWSGGTELKRFSARLQARPLTMAGRKRIGTSIVCV